MSKSTTFGVGSFVSSLYSRWRVTDSPGRSFYKSVAQATISPNPKSVGSNMPSSGTVDIDLSEETDPYLRFKPEHRQSASSYGSTLAVISSEEQDSLTYYAETIRAHMQEYNSLTEEHASPSKSRQAPILSPIEEEVEEDYVKVSPKSYGPNSLYSSSEEETGDDSMFSSPSLDSLTSIPEEDEDAEPVWSSASFERKNRSGKISATPLQSHVLHLESELEFAKREIQNLNAELAETVDSEQLIGEAEERMEELLLEKAEWNTTLKILKQNLALVTTELFEAKQTKEYLQHENGILRNIIRSYQNSVQALYPQPALIHRDDIERYNAELSTISMPPIHAETAYLSLGLEIPTRPRRPSLRSTKPLRSGKTSLPSKFSVGPEASRDLFSMKKNYKPLEGSPLRLVTLAIIANEHYSPKDGPSPMPAETDDDDDESCDFYDCNDSAQSASGRNSRLGMFSDEDVFLQS